MLETIGELYSGFFGSDSLLAPEYLFVTALIGWLIYRVRKPERSFWGWLIPREVYRHPSTWLDLRLFFISRAMVLTGVIGRISLTTFLALWVAGLVGRDTDPAQTNTSFNPVLLAFALWIVQDFAQYWTHRAHHRIAVIWPLHAVHHSAEVLSPLTAYRQHPLSILLVSLVISGIVGILQGLLLGALPFNAAIALVAGTNAFIVLANMAMANLHHSHIWLSYGPVLERVLISPAQHQVHHSTNPEHFDKNYGQTLALWDWLFGTLHVIDGTEQIAFGLEGQEDAALMSHSLRTSFADPVRRMWRALK